MQRCLWRWKLGLGLLPICFLANLNGCQRPLLSVIDTTDSVVCDPAKRPDCVSVTKGFVLGREADLMRIIRLQGQLKACQEK